ncbi:MAG: TSUP family transporter [Acidimicrobiia bacterium]
MITLGAVLIGITAALVVGLSKTAFPGAGLLATPLVALVFDGRTIAGAALPILLFADVFAVRWYRDTARWDLLRPLVPWVAIGFAAGAAFFIGVGRSGRSLDVTIGVSILTMVVVQVVRLLRRTAPAEPSLAAAALYGSAGGFTTFVSNNAGPILNTYLLRLGLGKAELVGTSAWFYFAVNVSKIPIYLTLGALSSGGSFFTGESLLFDLVCAPAVLVGVLSGRELFHRVPQQTFLVIVLVLSAAASVKLLVG